LILPVALALINIGSNLVLSITLSIFVSALLTSYAITIGCMLMHRLEGRALPPARFSLGKWGAVINVVALIYCLPLIIFSLFPPTPNPTPATMNWAVVMVGGPFILSTVYYVVWGRKTYTPPVETIEDYMERKLAVEKSATPDTGRNGSVDEAEKRLDVD
jgi:choline transport protein